jgi:ankyrin repeat protein
MKNKIIYTGIFIAIVAVLSWGLIYGYGIMSYKTKQVSADKDRQIKPDQASDILELAKKGNLSELKKLEGKKLNLYKRDTFGATPLHLAALKGNLKVVRFLVEKGTKINTALKGEPLVGLTPLHLAVQYGREDVVRYLIMNGADVNATPYRGQFLHLTPLHFAANCGRPQIAKILLKNGAKVNAKIKENPATTPLSYAYQLGFNKVVKVLKEYGGQKKYDGPQYPLHGALMSKNKSKVESLTKAGSNVNKKPLKGPYKGKTSLHVAAENGDSEMVKFLLSNGANLHVKTDYGATPLYMAAKNGAPEAVEILIEAGADVNLKTENTISLQVAAYEGNLATVKKLVNYGAKVNMKNASGADALWYAVQANNFEVVKFLAKHGADLKRGYGDGWTLLHLASAEACEKIVEFLLKKGLDPTAKTTGERRHTPITLAQNGDCKSKSNCKQLQRLFEKYK